MKIIIADDHAVFRDSFEFLLSSKTEHEVICAVQSIQALKAAMSQSHSQPQESVDLIFIDYHMPEGDALATADYLKQRFTNLKLAFLTGSQSVFILKNIVKSRADGVFHKEESTDKILSCLGRLANGERVVSDVIKEKIAVDDFQLTQREFHTLSLIAQGNTSPEIAKLMNISPRTVDKHKENLMKKMNVSNVMQLLACAYNLQLFNKE